MEQMHCPNCDCLIDKESTFCLYCKVMIGEKESLKADHRLYSQKESDSIFNIPKPWFYLFIGLALALLMGNIRLLHYMGWFIEALIHELGHCIAAWYYGCPAVPAIRLDGHAAAVHSCQKIGICIMMWGATAWGAWYFRNRIPLMAPLVVFALIYPLFAFTKAKEFWHLVSGHGGELIFAGIFFYRALEGGVYKEEERPLYAMLGWFIWLKNINLCWSLMYSQASRNTYMRSGSFGLENDYVRIGRLLGWNLEGVAALMLIVSVIIPAIGIGLWIWNKKKYA